MRGGFRVAAFVISCGGVEPEIAMDRTLQEHIAREDFAKLNRSWLNGLKLHAATMALTEFGAGMGDIRAARFGRDSAWRTMALFGALDEFRHTQIPLLLMHVLDRFAEVSDRDASQRSEVEAARRVQSILLRPLEPLNSDWSIDAVYRAAAEVAISTTSPTFRTGRFASSWAM